MLDWLKTTLLATFTLFLTLFNQPANLVQNTFNTSGLPPCQTESATGCDKGKLFSGSSACSGKGPAYITASPIDIDEISIIQPMGLMTGGHVTPIDHGYIYIKGATEKSPRQAQVKSPIAGVVTNVTHTVRDGPMGNYGDYALTIEATCTFRVRFSNLVSLSGKLGEKVGNLKPNTSASPNLKVTPGELIGYTGLPTAYGIDVWVENDEKTLTGFVVPAHYQTESWKTHMVDLFEYTKEPVKSQLLALDAREALPRWGKIDWDIDGKLVGNWFLEGTGGYSNGKANDYYKTHAAFVYDGIDPSQIVISLGNYQGEPQQFAATENSPDPKNVDQSTGLVKYELSRIEYYSEDTGKPFGDGLMYYQPHIRARARSGVEGVVLVQLIDKRKLKLEVFPGKHGSDVTGFDSKAFIYER